MSELAKKRRRQFEALAGKIERDTIKEIQSTETKRCNAIEFHESSLPKVLSDAVKFRSEMFALEFVGNGGDAVKAWRTIHPNFELTPPAIRKRVADLLREPYTRYCIDRMRTEFMKEKNLTIPHIINRMDENIKKAEKAKQFKTVHTGLKDLLTHAKPPEKEKGGDTHIGNLIVIPAQVPHGTPVKPILADEVPEGFSRKNTARQINHEEEDAE